MPPVKTCCGSSVHLQRIGRLKEKYQGIGQYYVIESIPDASGDKAMAINWSKQIKPGRRLAHAGVYCLRTNATKWNNARPWRTCSMLTGLEAVFRSLRSERGLRRVTASFPRADGGALQGRKATRPETELAAIFHALDIAPLPEGIQKAIVTTHP